MIDTIFVGILFWFFGGLVILSIYVALTDGRIWGKFEGIVLCILGLPFILPLFLHVTYVDYKQKRAINMVKKLSNVDTYKMQQDQYFSRRFGDNKMIFPKRSLIERLFNFKTK